MASGEAEYIGKKYNCRIIFGNKSANRRFYEGQIHKHNPRIVGLKEYGECHEANPSKMSEGAQSVTGSAPLVRSPHADHRLAKVDARKKVRESYAALIDPLVLHGN